MGVNDSKKPRPTAGIARVRCLGCSAGYLKPAGGGTLSANPGCPECGYVGWVRDQMTVSEDAEPSRSVSGRLRRRTA